MPQLPAPTIAGLTYERRLGAGGYADVYLYQQALPARRVAVKIASRDIAFKSDVDGVRLGLASEAAVEATARELFVHPNTVRYRLRRVEELSSYSPSDPRDAFVLRLALTLGTLMRRQ